MARRALMLREGRAPVWDRLLTMLFFVALLHGLIILGLTFNAAAGDQGSAPGLRGAAGLRRAARGRPQPTATYLAQRTQLGSGNTRAVGRAAQPRRRRSRRRSTPGPPRATPSQRRGDMAGGTPTSGC